MLLLPVAAITRRRLWAWPARLVGFGIDEGDTALRAARGNFGLVWVQGKGAYYEPYADWTMRSYNCGATG